MKTLILLISVAIITSGCAHHHKNLPKESHVKVVNGLKGHRFDNIYFSSQPNQKQINQLKKGGFTTVINLRNKIEKNYSESWEKNLTEKNGLNYHHFPFDMKKELNDDYISQVTNAVKKHRRDGKILIHCSTGNRVAIWLGAHFKKDHGFSNEKSLSLARELGLDKPKAEKKLKSYFK